MRNEEIVQQSQNGKEPVQCFIFLWAFFDWNHGDSTRAAHCNSDVELREVQVWGLSAGSLFTVAFSVCSEPVEELEVAPYSFRNSTFLQNTDKS